MMEFHARTYYSADEMRSAYRDRWYRLRTPQRLKEPPKPAEEQGNKPAETAPRTFDHHVWAWRRHLVQFSGSPLRTYIFNRCIEMKVPYTGIMSRSRKQTISKARQLLMWEVSVQNSLTLNEIARIFGGRDHTTVLHSVRRVQALIDTGQIKNPLTGKYEAKGIPHG